jgi:hypothetical protein
VLRGEGGGGVRICGVRRGLRKLRGDSGEASQPGVHRHVRATYANVTVKYILNMYRYAPHNDVSVNDVPHIRRWTQETIILQQHYVTTACSIQYGNTLYRFFNLRAIGYTT